MTIYVKNNQPYSADELRALHPNVSLPDGGDMTQYGYAHLVMTPAPQAEPGHAVVQGTIVDGAQTWVQVPIVVEVPQSVTMRQARLALLNAGLLTEVNSAVAGMSGAAGDAARIEWEFSSMVERHKVLVTSLGTVLGLSDAQLDALFINAATL